MKYHGFSKIWIIVILCILIAGGIFVWQYLGVPKEKVSAPEEKNKTIEDLIQKFYTAIQMENDQGAELVMSYFTPPATTEEKESYDWLTGADLPKGSYRVFMRIKISNPLIKNIEKIEEGRFQVNATDEFQSWFNGTGEYSKPISINITFIVVKIEDKWLVDKYIWEDPNIVYRTEKYSGFGQEEIIADLTNWKDYPNPEVNFTFKYPSDWEIKEQYEYKSAACQMDPKCKGVRYIFINKIADSRPANMGEKDKFGIAINMPQCTGVKRSDLVGDNWICVFDVNPEVLNIYEGIKKSFQLTKDETATWKTYRNENYGFEIKYPQDWDYIILEMPNNPIMFAPQDIITKTKQSLGSIKSDKSFTLWVTIYDKTLFEGGILPYRGKSNEYIKVTSSNIDMGGIKGNKYVSEYIKDKSGYKAGEKTVTIDLPIKNGYLSMQLFDYQYLNVFEKMLSTFKFLK